MKICEIWQNCYVLILEYIGSAYFSAKMPTVTAWLEQLCRQSEAWQKQSKNKR